ncbi:C-type lectin 37Db-like [Lytechinus variegatus]|uniref:C-type lectin 37Db-like n=1 Tax=Lytechinus variegatus TaxID=7654 RepID=UPI001BB236C3|nr:C-type lectin 37Db-like [Lytechinus variegatus]
MINIESIGEFEEIRPHLSGKYVWNHCERPGDQWNCYRNREGSLTSYRNWAADQPDNNPGENCALIYVSDGKMHDYHCDESAAAVCQAII